VSIFRHGIFRNTVTLYGCVISLVVILGIVYIHGLHSIFLTRDLIGIGWLPMLIFLLIMLPFTEWSKWRTRLHPEGFVSRYVQWLGRAKRQYVPSVDSRQAHQPEGYFKSRYYYSGPNVDTGAWYKGWAARQTTIGSCCVQAAMESVQPAAAAAHANAAPALAAAAAASSVFVFLPKSVLTELLTSGISVGCANTATNPLGKSFEAPSAPMCADVVKVRLQLASNAAQASGVKPPGMVATGLSVLRNEGVTALWSGLGPSLARGFFFGGARLGLYTPIKSAIMGGNSSSASFELKVLSGSLSGGLAAAVTSPIELVKTRLQVTLRAKIWVRVRHMIAAAMCPLTITATAGGPQAAGKTPGAQKTSMGVIRAVMAADGVAGLWKGAMPGLFRSAILTASQCATYDEVKRGVLNYTGWSDGTHTHFTSSMIAGLVTTTITNPLDVIKTRMFVSGGRYKGALECASHVLKTEGPIGFMKISNSSSVTWHAPISVTVGIGLERQLRPPWSPHRHHVPYGREVAKVCRTAELVRRARPCSSPLQFIMQASRQVERKGRGAVANYESYMPQHVGSMPALHRALYRSVLHIVRQFHKDGIPLLGVAGAPPLLSAPYASIVAPHDAVSRARQLFRGATGLTSDDAIAAIRALSAQHKLLVTCEPETRSAMRAWHQLLHQHMVHGASTQQDSHPGRLHFQQPASASDSLGMPCSSPQALNLGLEQAVELVQQLHDEEQPPELDLLDTDTAEGDQVEVGAGSRGRTEVTGSGVEQLAADPFSSEPADVTQLHLTLADHGLGPGLELMACQLSAQMSQAQPDSLGHGAVEGHGGPDGCMTPSQQLEAVRFYLYRHLRLRHEPIEWVYDGLRPLLLRRAIARRKAAPLALGMLAAGLSSRVGLPAVVVRATPLVDTSGQGPANLLGSVLGGQAAALKTKGLGAQGMGRMSLNANYLQNIPDGVAARQAGRAASVLPSDCWLVVAVQPRVSRGDLEHPTGQGAAHQQHSLQQQLLVQKQEGQQDKKTTSDQRDQRWHGHISRTKGGARAGVVWEPSGVFLDVSVRGGAVLDWPLLTRRYPQVASQLQQQLKAGTSLASPATFQSLVADLVRTVLTARQRRGESDSVAHWLWQLLALDPGAPEWQAVLAASPYRGASGSGQQEVVGERRQVIKAAIRGLVEAARPDLSPAQVDAVVAEMNKRMTMGSKQCCLTAVMLLQSMLLQSFLGQPTEGFPAAGPAPDPPPPPDPACPPYTHPRLATRSSPRSAAPPAQLPPPVPLNIEGPKLLAQIKDAMELLTTVRVLEHLMRGPHHSGIKLLPAEVAVFEQPSSAWPVAKLKELDEMHLTGDGNSLNANATTISTSINEFYRHPGRFIKWWGKAIGVVEGGFSRDAQKHFPQLVLGRLDYSLPDREHRWRLPVNSVLRQPRWVAEVAKHRRLLGLEARWLEGVDSIGKGGAGRLPLEKRVRYALFVNRSLEGWQQHDTCPRPFTMLPMVGVRARHFVIDDRVLHGVLADLGMSNLTRAQVEADSLPQWQRFIQYSQLQNSGWDFARRVETDGVSISVHFVRSQVGRGPVELPFIGRQLTATSDFNPTTHIAVGVDPGVTQAIKAGHAQRDPVTGQVLRQWEWELSKGQLKHDSGLTKAKQNTVRWSTAIQPQLLQLAAATPAGTTLGGLHAHVLALKATWDALWEEYLKPRWHRRGEWRCSWERAASARVGGNPRRWLDRDTNACLNFQRIGESMQRPLELCSWKDREALPPVGKEYQQGYKRVNDQLPKVRQRLHRAAEYRRGIDASLAAIFLAASLAASFAASLAASLAASIAASLAASFLATILRNESQALMHQRKAGATCCEQRRGQTDYGKSLGPSPAQPSPAQPSPAQPSPAQPSPAQPSPAQPSPAQPSPAQPSPAQPSPAQPSPAQPSPAQPSPAQPSPAQPSPAQPSPAQPSPAQPSPAQPSPAQPSPAQPSPAQPSPAQPSPAQPSPAQPSPAQPSPAQPSPAQPSPAQPSPAQPSPAQPSPAQPSPAQPSPAQPSPAQPSPAQPSSAQPSPAQPSPAQPSPAQPSPAQPYSPTLHFLLR
ncbi:hypothetical protein QJQ45_030272, partial [Haematococcus lacustris]